MNEMKHFVRKSLVVGSVALALAIAATPPTRAETKELDFSKGSFAGWVWFVWEGEDGPTAQAAVAIGRLQDARLEQAYGLSPAGEESHVGPIEAEKIGQIATGERHVLAIKVAPMMFDEVRHLIYHWGNGQDHGSQNPAMIAENLFDRVAKRIGLKTPYRSALASSRPIYYLQDLSRVNR